MSTKRTTTVAAAPTALKRRPAVNTPVRVLRIRKGLTQIDLALAAGISPTWMCMVEHAPALLSDEVAGRLAAALGCGPDDLRPAVE